MKVFNQILKDASGKYPVLYEEKESVIEEIMRRGLDEPNIPEDKKARWRRALKERTFKGEEVDKNAKPRQRYIRTRTSLAKKKGLFNKTELKQLNKYYDTDK